MDPGAWHSEAGALLPCPFCRDHDVDLFDDRTAEDGLRYAIGCNECGARGPHESTPEKAGERWNAAHRSWSTDDGKDGA